MSNPPRTIPSAPSPWLNLPVSTYMLPFISKPPLLDHAYAPLEASSSFASSESSGAFQGGLGMLQIVRYHDSPVGPYDELLIVPGYFDVPGKKSKGGMVRVTRIYVSTKESVWNGKYFFYLFLTLQNTNFCSSCYGFDRCICWKRTVLINLPYSQDARIGISQSTWHTSLLPIQPQTASL
jgi:hypothetical protein